MPDNPRIHKDYSHFTDADLRRILSAPDDLVEAHEREDASRELDRREKDQVLTDNQKKVTTTSSLLALLFGLAMTVVGYWWGGYMYGAMTTGSINGEDFKVTNFVFYTSFVISFIVVIAITTEWKLKFRPLVILLGLVFPHWVLIGLSIYGFVTASKNKSS